LSVTNGVPLHALASRKWGNPTGRQHNTVLKQSVGLMIILGGLINCRKARGFRLGTWNVDSQTGRAGELVEILPDRKVDVANIEETRWRAVVATTCGLKVKGISCV